jgi:hypothetical protein
VKLLVMLAMRKRSARRSRVFVARSAIPNERTNVPRPGIQMPTLKPGVRDSTMALRTIDASSRFSPGVNAPDAVEGRASRKSDSARNPRRRTAARLYASGKLLVNEAPNV